MSENTPEEVQAETPSFSLDLNSKIAQIAQQREAKHVKTYAEVTLGTITETGDDGKVITRPRIIQMPLIEFWPMKARWYILGQGRDTFRGLPLLGLDPKDQVEIEGLDEEALDALLTFMVSLFGVTPGEATSSEKSSRSMPKKSKQTSPTEE